MDLWTIWIGDGSGFDDVTSIDGLIYVYTSSGWYDSGVNYHKSLPQSFVYDSYVITVPDSVGLLSAGEYYSDVLQVRDAQSYEAVQLDGYYMIYVTGYGWSYQSGDIPAPGSYVYVDTSSGGLSLRYAGDNFFEVVAVVETPTPAPEPTVTPTPAGIPMDGAYPTEQFTSYYSAVLLTVMVIGWTVLSIFKVIEKRRRDNGN